MALEQLSFSKDWTDPADFPTVETNETVIRQDMQQLHDETKNYLNGTLLPGIEAGYVPVGRKVNGHALTGNVTVTKGDVGLGQVDNTADMDKPVSTAQAAAIQAAVLGQLPAGSVGKEQLSPGVAAAVSRAETGGALDQSIAAAAAERAALLHASQHGASGSDPVTPAAIGAVAKSGDTLTGNLTIVRDGIPQLSFKDSANLSYGNIQHNNHATDISAKEDISSGADFRSLRVSDFTRASTAKSAVQLVERVGGATAMYDVLHTGNLADYVSSKTAVVEYTGTGETGVSVVIGFVPKLVIVQEVSNSGSPGTLPLILTGVGKAAVLALGSYSTNLDWYAINVTAFGSTVSWSGNDSKAANNKSSTTYRVVAIG